MNTAEILDAIGFHAERETIRITATDRADALHLATLSPERLFDEVDARARRRRLEYERDRDPGAKPGEPCPNCVCDYCYSGLSHCFHNVCTHESLPVSGCGCDRCVAARAEAETAYRAALEAQLPRARAEFLSAGLPSAGPR